ncbi:DUF689-domain-containing protein [Auriculariales sp. MPI-PUGE-AT-0066]|nr:DUF689-domain-containing protein [Auriculariales sp. MPI-PUGE-AT-0066]
MSPPVQDLPTPSDPPVLVVGSLATANDGSYQSVISSVQQHTTTVDKQLVDRILDNAVTLAPERYSAVHVVLSAGEYLALQPRLGSLFATILLALRPQGFMLAPASDTTAELVVTKPATVAAKSVLLPRRANGVAKKKNALWALSESAPGTPPIDADALLTDADRARPPPCEPFRADGTPRRKKACKNCSCGLAEIEAEEELNAVTVVLDATADALKSTKITSSCGSCYLGDAFRCASCPYLGLPAFEPGQKVELVNMDDDI